ncbi:hypothetical protein LZ32DRAFT_458700 [Colletotrichum eremochloae]|nr:hypothetical protein LZ32DRAFT_458700 [Colletotrichum eremochloae]
MLDPVSTGSRRPPVIRPKRDDGIRHPRIVISVRRPPSLCSRGRRRKARTPQASAAGPGYRGGFLDLREIDKIRGEGRPGVGDIWFDNLALAGWTSRGYRLHLRPRQDSCVLACRAGEGVFVYVAERQPEDSVRVECNRRDGVVQYWAERGGLG